MDTHWNYWRQEERMKITHLALVELEDSRCFLENLWIKMRCILHYRERAHRLSWTRLVRYDFCAFSKETSRIVSQEITFVTNRPSRASNTCLKLGNLKRLPLGRAESDRANPCRKEEKKIRSHTCIKMHLHFENAHWLTRRHNKKMNNYFVTNWFLSKLKFTYNQDRSLIKTKQIINDKYLLILWNCFLLKLNLFIFFQPKGVTCWRECPR